MDRLAHYLVPFAVAAILSGCGAKQSLQNADAEVDHFHAALNAGNWSELWSKADPQFQAATTRDRFGRLLDAVHRKAGRVLGSREIDWNATSGSGGDFVTVTTQTSFEHGGGTEQFVFRRHDRKLALAGYNIDSRDVAMN